MDREQQMNQNADLLLIEAETMLSVSLLAFLGVLVARILPRSSFF